MDLKSAFEASLLSSDFHRAPEDFLGTPLRCDMPDGGPLLRLLSAGSLRASSPFSVDLSGLPCHMMLYTREGCGKLIRSRQVYTLDESSFLFLDCRERFRIDAAPPQIWRYDVLFAEGEALDWYAGQAGAGEPALLALQPCAEIVLCMERLLSVKSPVSSSLACSVSGLLHYMASAAAAARSDSLSPDAQPPSYLRALRELLDENFADSHSLESLSRRFHVSKYRLCREFKEAYGCPPIQYLNRRRIRMACHLLVTTDRKVHEIGSLVGIANVNHFISLFRKYMSMTPLEYKQRMTS